MKNVSQYAGCLGSLAMLLFFSVVEARSCTVGVWRSPELPQLFRIQGSDGRTLAIVLLPKNHVVMSYGDQTKGHVETVSTIWRGTDSDHYFGPVWHSDIGGLMGWRLFPAGFEPYAMEIEVKDKFLASKGDSTLPAIGRKTREIVGFGQNALYFDGMVLNGLPLDPDVLVGLSSFFSEPETLQTLKDAVQQSRPAA